MSKVLGIGLILLLTGCSLTPGNKLIFFPETHDLLDATTAVMQNSSAPLALPRELDKRPLPAYVVEPGDVLLVQAANLDSPIRLPADQPVLPDGTINLGRYGQLIVAGRTVDEIEKMAQELVAAQNKDAGPITVRIVTRQSKVYYVLGEVNAPGAFPLNGRETVLDGILAAGGLNDRASRKNIILARPSPPEGCRTVLPICYREIVQLGDTTTNYQLAPGDRIFVATRTCYENSCFSHDEDNCCGPCHGPQTPCPVPTKDHDPALAPPGTGVPVGPQLPALPPAPSEPAPMSFSSEDLK